MPTTKPKKEVANKGGRPSAYRPEFAAQAEKLCQSGLTDFELARFFNVSERTIYSWRDRHPEFLQALKAGKAISDDRVERSLFHRAVGYTFEAEEVFQYQGKIIRATVIKHVPPDTTSMIFWLKNRRKDRWRDVQSHEVRTASEFDKMSKDELAQALEEAKQQLLEAPKVIDHDDDAS